VTPPLVVRHPRGYEAERRYAYDVVLKEFLGLEATFVPEDRRDVELTLAGDETGAAVTVADVLFATPETAWLTSASLPSEPLARCRDLDPRRPLPVLYGTPTAEGIDIFGSVFFLLTRYEELVSDTRDGHERFPASASIAMREGFIDRPLANEYVESLWTRLSAAWPRLTRRKRTYALRLSHDVDVPLYRAPRHEARGRARRDVKRDHAPLLAIRRVVNAYVPNLIPKSLDLANTFDWLMRASEELGLRSAFYFIAGRSAGPIDGSYEIDDPWILGLLARIHSRGHEIGVHPSYNTFLDAGRTRSEVERLRRACNAAGVGEVVRGGRQHYLRWRNPETWQNWEEAGLEYDSTLAFADRVGFRSGTCYEHPVFNLRTRTALRLRERPLVVMDASLLEYQQVGLDAIPAEVTRLAETVRRFDGEMTLLWHNDRLGSRRAYRAYRRAIAAACDAGRLAS
jgi:hypothetical protein